MVKKLAEVGFLAHLLYQNFVLNQNLLLCDLDVSGHIQDT